MLQYLYGIMFFVQCMVAGLEFSLLLMFCVVRQTSRSGPNKAMFATHSEVLSPKEERARRVGEEGVQC